MAEGESFLVGTPCDFVEVLGEVEGFKEVCRISLDKLVIEQFLEDLADDQLPSLDDFGLVAVEPILAQTLLFGDLEGVFIVPLHICYDIADGREAKVQQFLKVEVLHFYYVLSVLLERSRTDFFGTKHADEH